MIENMYVVLELDKNPFQICNHHWMTILVYYNWFHWVSFNHLVIIPNDDKTICCNSMESYMSHLQKQSFIRDLQTLDSVETLVESHEKILGHNAKVS